MGFVMGRHAQRWACTLPHMTRRTVLHCRLAWLRLAWLLQRRGGGGIAVHYTQRTTGHSLIVTRVLLFILAPVDTPG